jgi:hypothetical protein
MVAVPRGLLGPLVSLGRKVKVRKIYETMGSWVYHLHGGLPWLWTYLGG